MKKLFNFVKKTITILITSKKNIPAFLCSLTVVLGIIALMFAIVFDLFKGYNIMNDFSIVAFWCFLLAALAYLVDLLLSARKTN